MKSEPSDNKKSRIGNLKKENEERNGKQEGRKNDTTLEEKQFTNYHHQVSNCLTFLYKR